MHYLSTPLSELNFAIDVHGMRSARRIPKNANEMMAGIFMWAVGKPKEVWSNTKYSSAALHHKVGAPRSRLQTGCDRYLWPTHRGC